MKGEIMVAAVSFFGVTGGLGGLCVAILVVALALLGAAALKTLIR
jgi:hypothetical protein